MKISLLLVIIAGHALWAQETGEALNEVPVDSVKAPAEEPQVQKAVPEAPVAAEPAAPPENEAEKKPPATEPAPAAKEVFVAQMGIVYAVGQAEEPAATLREKLRRQYQPLTGFCIMLFCLIAAPCLATVAITRREAGGR